MAKLIVWNLVTVDGYFEGDKKWDLDFHNKAWGPELEKLSLEFGKNAEALVFGRVTYEGMRDYWTTTTDEGPIKDFMNALPKLVASRARAARGEVGGDQRLLAILPAADVEEIVLAGPQLVAGLRVVSASMIDSEVTMVRDSVSFNDRLSSGTIAILRYLRRFSRIRS